MQLKYGALILSGLLASAASQAAPTLYRWTKADKVSPELKDIVALINERAGTQLTASDYKLNENRKLAFSSYLRFDQVAQGVPVKNLALRVWLSPDRKDVLQAEAYVEPSMQTKARRAIANKRALMTEAATRSFALAAMKDHSDNTVRTATGSLEWRDNTLVYTFVVKSKRGQHEISVNAANGAVMANSYKLYPDADQVVANEFSIKANVYPIYEEYKGTILDRKPVELKHVLHEVRYSSHDPFISLKDKNLLYSLYDSVLAQTEEGRAQGYWSNDTLQKDAAQLASHVQNQPNSFFLPGVRLTGKYVTINLHPDVVKEVKLGPEKRYSTQFMFNWLPLESGDYKVVPQTALIGKRWPNPRSIYEADATRDPNHSVAKYVRSGFDEIQVYYAVNTLFETLRPRGFTDEDLGSRPFNAFLFNPDIEMRDNAFYDADTINFTTYSPEQPNYARDNLTIWHELGHGVMDRLMGNRLQLADTGGLSEGMADFVAEMILQALTDKQDFPGAEARRIVNQTGFFLTNEVHDDGEAYGGTMRVILDLAKEKKGAKGVDQVIDLTLEAMRLTRDHPRLTAQDWFDHMLYADSLGRSGLRDPGELRDVIQQALDSRNFASEAERATFSLAYNGKEVVAGAVGSRGNEVPVSLKADETATYNINVSLKDGQDFHFKYPVTVKVFYNSGPLQGAIDWKGEDTEPTEIVVNDAEHAKVAIPLTINGKCDFFNRDDQSCSDFAYVQIWNAGETAPVAKKRFYLRLKAKE